VHISYAEVGCNGLNLLSNKVPFIKKNSLLEEEGEVSSTDSPRVRYKPSNHPCRKNTLATSLCSWSPNDLVST
jgi:hypothetical protein